MTKQHDETLSYFNETGEAWRRLAEGNVKDVNVIAQRNASALRVCARLGTVRRSLDIGCGTGELVLALAETVDDCLGIDFADEMIKASEDMRCQLDIKNAVFARHSVQSFEAPSEPFDLISAMGLIEYISPEEVEEMVAKYAAMLRSGGSFVVGSRNRLFNLFSLNDYTIMEQKLGLIDILMREAVAIASAPDMRAAVAAAATCAQNLPQPESHPGTGIDVSLRYQYTPGDLIRLFKKHGLETAALFPINIHAMPMAAAAGMKDDHIRISNLIYEIAPENHRLIPTSSSFVIDARKI